MTADATSPYGHVVRLVARDRVVIGELVAIDEAGVWVRTGKRAVRDAVGPHRVIGAAEQVGHVFVPEPEVDRIRIHRYRVVGATFGTAGWGLGAMLLTLSHGWYFYISMPITAVAAIAATAATYGQSIIVVGRRRPWSSITEQLREYARFPAGAPPGWPGPPPSHKRPQSVVQSTDAAQHDELVPSTAPRFEIEPNAATTSDDARGYVGPAGVRVLEPTR